MRFSRTVGTLAAVASGFAGVSAMTTTAADAAACQTVFTSRGTFTAQQVDPATVTGTVDATGCDIAVYYTPGSTGGITDADIHGSLWYGVFNDGGAVTIADSEIHDIGDSPQNGVQRGVAVLFDRGAQGSVVDSQIYRYQKNGFVISAVNGAGTYADILRNSVRGAGAVSYIAQNGVQVSSGASATIEDNEISGNDYTPKDWVACGILYFDADGVRADRNKFRDNERNVCNFGRGGGNASGA